MALKSFNPYTASRRYLTVLDRSEVTKDHPEKSLVEPRKRSGGRNAHGEVTVWHRGGGHKRQYRAIDFKREDGSPEGDRSAFIEVKGVAMIHPYWDMAILRVEGLPAAHGVLRLSVNPPEDLSNRDVVVIGYPFLREKPTWAGGGD